MLKRLREHGRLAMTGFLVALGLFCLLLFLGRTIVTDNLRYLFLNWNLFLAFIPWLLTSFAILWKIRNRIAVIVILAVWLAFFPNSLYLLTDLIHIRMSWGAPVWFDLILVLSYAWTGLCFGFISLRDIESLLATRFGASSRIVTLLSVVMVYLAAFGIYLGRFLRWNSWDLFGSLPELLVDIVGPLADPLNNLRFWGFTSLMGTLLNFMYFGFKIVSSRAAPSEAERPPA